MKAAGPRYTPEVHVDLPIGQDMERFSKSHFLFDEVKSLAGCGRKVRRSAAVYGASTVSAAFGM